MADLADFYPQAGVAGQSVRGDGKPANPAAGAPMRGVNVAASASVNGSPVLAVIALVGVSLFLLHLGQMDKGTIDFLIRSVVTGMIALVLVSAVVYEALVHGKVDTTLGGWAGLVIGAYFGTHATTNGKLAGKVGARTDAAAK